MFTTPPDPWHGWQWIALAMLLLQSVLLAALLTQGRRRKRLDAERKRVEAECMHQRQQLTHLTRVTVLGQLSGAFAHELNQPLTSILSNAQAALHYLNDGRMDVPEVREILRAIINDDKRAGEMIRRLRAMLKRGESQLQPVDLHQLIFDTLALAHSDLVARQVEVGTQQVQEVRQVLCDCVQIQQVMLNLLLNAAEAMRGNDPQERRIEICLAPEDRAAHVIVRDWGTGIGQDRLENVFDAFYTTKDDGLGLGLSICRSIVTAHGGRLWATNNPLRGAAFHFTLPLPEGAPA